RGIGRRQRVNCQRLPERPYHLGGTDLLVFDHRYPRSPLVIVSTTRASLRPPPLRLAESIGLTKVDPTPNSMTQRAAGRAKLPEAGPSPASTSVSRTRRASHAATSRAFRLSQSGREREPPLPDRGASLRQVKLSNSITMAL